MLAAMIQPLTLRLVRVLYSLALYLSLPMIVYHLIWRGFRYREYLRRWPERFGFFQAVPRQPVIWVHAVSVGEVKAATPLIEALFVRYPEHRIALTCFTPTASEQVQALWGTRVFHVYAPYDLPDSVDRFLGRLRPRLAIIMETEIWPNLYLGCAQRQIPLVVANARLSQKSLNGYGPVRKIMARIIDTACVIAAQSEADAERLKMLGARPDRVRAVGNLKYDMTVPEGFRAGADAMRRRWGARPVWIAASTHPDEETAVIAMHQRIRQRYRDALLLWAPRHPERFAPVVLQARNAGWQVRTRSADRTPDQASDCFVIDSLGELLAFYACADVAFVGGSLQAIGGHNVLEPAALCVPVVVGPHMFNFTEVAEMLQAAGGMRQEADPESVAEALLELLADEAGRQAMGQAGAALVSAQRGAVDRTLALIAECFPAVARPQAGG